MENLFTLSMTHGASPNNTLMRMAGFTKPNLEGKPNEEVHYQAVDLCR
jgi:hypothetical protein